MKYSKIKTSLGGIAILMLVGQPSFGEIDLDIGKFEDFRYSTITSIPAGDPRKFKDASLCFLENVWTPEGEEIYKKGWAVTSEVRFAAYTLVSFNGKIEVGTSGTCFRSEGNIALFLNSKLQGLVYIDDPTDTSIGRLSLQEGGIIRLHNGDPTDFPVLDIRYTNDGFSFSEVSDFTTYCEGKNVVPNVYGMDIKEARHEIIKMGWRPLIFQSEGEEITPIVDKMRKEGITEVYNCSGTGMGYCDYSYYQQNDLLLNLLEVSSIEPARVNSIRVDCGESLFIR
jgi:hypothetical protein